VVIRTSEEAVHIEFCIMEVVVIPVFLGGTGRSGTSIALKSLLNCSEIVGLHQETQFIVAPNSGLLSLIDKNFSREALESFENNLWGRWYLRKITRPNGKTYSAGLHKIIELDDLKALYHTYLGSQPSERKVVEFIRKIYDILPGSDKAVYWCEKTPANLLFADRLNGLFPDMKFIHLVRDGRDVVTSIMKNRFWPIACFSVYNKLPNDFEALRKISPPREFTVINAALYWRDSLTLGKAALSRLSASQIIEVKMEDLVDKKDGTVSMIGDFLGVDLTDAFAAVGSIRAHVGYYRENLTADEIAECNYIMGDFLEEYGYL
jgi:hypothetical protein